MRKSTGGGGSERKNRWSRGKSHKNDKSNNIKQVEITVKITYFSMDNFNSKRTRNSRDKILC